MSTTTTPEGARRQAFGGRGPDHGDLEHGDPAHDALGTVRRSPHGRWLANLLPSPPHSARWHVQGQHGAGGYETTNRVAHWPVVGAIPWSPAAGVPLDGTEPTPVRSVYATTQSAPRTTTARPPRVADAETTGGRL